MSLIDLSSFQSDPLAAAVMAQITSAKWRKARDSAKELYKKDKAKYLPLLIAANAGLAEEMLERGLLTDAETVISYLKTIAPPATIEALEQRRRQRQSAAVLIKGTPADALATAWQLVSKAAAPDSASGKEFQLAADRLAVTAQLPDGTDAPELREEWAALRKAMDATAQAQWEDAKAALRGIPARSVFGPWRLFLRGVRCVHTGELDAARQCFEALPAGTAAARAAWAYRPACGLPAGTDLPAASARATYPALLCGASPKASAAIAEADVLWRKKDLASAYGVLGPAFGRGEFPTEKPGLAGALTDLFLSNDFRGNTLEFTALDDFLDWLDLRLERSTSLQPVEEKLMRLQFLRLDGPALDAEEVLEYAQKIIALDGKVQGPAPLRAAAVWALAAAALEASRSDENSLSGKEYLPHQERAIALQRCVELDPDDPARRVLMLEHFKQADDHQGFRAQVRQALTDFPEHSGILSLAAVEAHEQGEKNAAELLRKARRMDPGNEAVAAALYACLRDAGPDLPDGTRSPAQWNEMEALAKPSPAFAPEALEPIDLERLRWFMKLRRALSHPQTDESPGLMDAAFKLAPSSFIGHLTAGILTNLPPSSAHPGSATGKGGAQVTWNDLIWALHLMQWHLKDREDPAWTAGMEDLLTGLAVPLIDVKTLSTLEGAKGVLTFARASHTIQAELEGRPDKALPNRFMLTVSQAVNQLMPRKMNYQAVIASVMLPAQALRHGWFLPCRCPELEQAGAAALAAGDRASVILAKRLIEECGKITAPPWLRLKSPPKKKPATTAKKAVAKKLPAKKAPAKNAAAQRKNSSEAGPDSTPSPTPSSARSSADDHSAAPAEESKTATGSGTGTAAAKVPSESSPRNSTPVSGPVKASPQQPQFTQPDLF